MHYNTANDNVCYPLR